MQISINIQEIAVEELLHEDLELVEKARQATALSYSPYSHFAVGAAVLLANGEIIKGANQENAAYPVGICAERTALSTANNLFPDVPVVAIALAAKDATGEFVKDYVTPCGMCRQTLAECEKRSQTFIRIIMTSDTKAAIATKVADLLPLAFV